MILLIDEYCSTRGYSSDTIDLLKKDLQYVYNTAISSETFIIERMVSFIRKQKFKSAIIRAAEMISKNEDAFEIVLKEIDAAVSVGAGIEKGKSFADLLSFRPEYKKAYSKDVLLKTGFESFDKCILGGMAPGELHLITSPPGRGKTTLGVNIGAFALLQGFLVVHITLEVKELDLMAKYACFTPDTKISLLNGTEVPIIDLVGLREFYVYSRDLSTGEIVPGRAHSCRKTGTKSILKITLDNGEVIRSTYDHLYLLKSGNRYKRADELVVGESLSPLYRRLDKKGYEEYLDKDGTYKSTHRMTYHYKYGKKIKKMETAHHKNFNRRDNEPKNILAINPLIHLKYHSDIMHKRMTYLSSIGEHPWQSDKYKRSKSLKMKTHNPMFQQGAKDKISVHMTTNNPMKNAETIARHPGLWSSDNAPSQNPDIMKKIVETNRKNGLYQRVGSITSKILNANHEMNNKQVLGRCKKVLDKLNEQGLPLTRDNYTTIKKTCAHSTPGYDYYISHVANHKVVSIEQDGYSDVYDFTVDTHHNFALSAGVFVHNCRCTGYTYSELMNVSDEEYTKRFGKFEQLKPKLRVKYYTPNTINSHTIRAFISRIRAEEDNCSKIFIIIDYDDYVLPVTVSKGEMYTDAGNVYADFIGLGDYFKAPVLTFSQPQRGAWNKEAQDGIQMDELAHSAKKAHLAYSVSSLNVPRENKQFGFWYVDKVRRGVDQIKIPLALELDRSLIYEDQERIQQAANPAPAPTGPAVGKK
jgi:hypothetical protein